MSALARAQCTMHMHRRFLSSNTRVDQTRGVVLQKRLVGLRGRSRNLQEMVNPYRGSISISVCGALTYSLLLFLHGFRPLYSSRPIKILYFFLRDLSAGSVVTPVSELIGTLFQSVATDLCLSLVTNNPPTPIYMFLVGFWPLHFENVGKIVYFFLKRKVLYGSRHILQMMEHTTCKKLHLQSLLCVVV